MFQRLNRLSGCHQKPVLYEVRDTMSIDVHCSFGHRSFLLLLVTSATLLVTSALLVVTKSYIRLKLNLIALTL